MAWERLPENYTDAVWNGLKRYTEVNNDDGTVSFQDVTVYSNKENSFFGAKDANRMNQALNIIMGMVENGTDLYTAFWEYFSTQKELFESAVNINMTDFEDYIAARKTEGDEIVDALKTDYREEITEFETAQEQVFNTWFGFIKDQLGEDAAGNLQNQIVALREYSDSTFLSQNGGDLIGELKMNGQPISGLNMPTEDDQAANMGFVNQQMREASPRNLLDNSDFRNPVNQRGKTTYDEATAGHTIDRWKRAAALTLEVMDSYVRATCTSTTGPNGMSQFLEYPPAVGTKVTLALKEKNGELYVGAASVPESGYNNAFKTAGGILGQIRVDRITIMVPVGRSIDIEWVAAYEGEYTAETLPEYQPKGYGAELAECQRYFYKVATMGALGYTHTATEAYVIFITPVEMRVVPTVVHPDTVSTIRIGGTAYSDGIVVTDTVYKNGNQLRLKLDISGAGLSGNHSFTYMRKSGTLEFTADINP